MPGSKDLPAIGSRWILDSAHCSVVDWRGLEVVVVAHTERMLHFPLVVALPDGSEIQAVAEELRPIGPVPSVPSVPSSEVSP